MDTEVMQDKLYDAYKLDWMIQHGHSLFEIVNGISEKIKDKNNDNDVLLSYADWLRGDGFNGELFADFDEFQDNELRDREYIEGLIENMPYFIREELLEAYNGYMKEEEQISLREETPENDCVYTLTEEGSKKVNAYILELRSKRKEILEAGLDTIENTGALPNFQDIIEDVNMSYDEDYKAYYGDWGVTDNYEADRTLDLHLKEDLVKTNILEVSRLDNEHYALVTYQQGNRLGTLIASVSALEEERELLQNKFGPDFQQSDMQLVFNMMSSGKLFHVPDLRDLPLIDEQPHALQSMFRESKNCDLGRIYIDEKDGAIYLNEMNCNDSLLFDAMGHNVYPGLEEIKDELRDFVCDHPNFKDIIHFDSCDSPIVIDEDFSTFFASRDKSLRQMIYIVEDSLMEIASPDSSKEAGRKTLEEAMERRGLDKDDFMELMQNAAKSKEVRYEIPIGGAVKINTQKERVDAVYTFRKWMKEPGKKIAKEIETLKARGKGVGK